MKMKQIACVLAGLMTASAYVNADNSASAYTGMTAVIGANAVSAGLADDDGWTKVLSTELKNSGTPTDLVIGLSFETMLYTETVVKSKGGDKSSSTASAEINMKVFVDGVLAVPGDVTFDKREQTLWAKLSGVSECIDGSVDGIADNIINYDECELTDEEIGLILDTKSAHTFNFLANNIGSGGHTIEAYAQLVADGVVVAEGTASGTHDESAVLGKGTLSVWEVHDSVTH
jgi:hypothetical protein